MTLLTDHGATGDGRECGEALQAALDVGGRIDVPAGRYVSTRTLYLRRSTQFVGHFGAGPYSDTTLEFGDGNSGLVVLPGSDYSTIADLAIVGQWKTVPGCHGIVLQAKTAVRNCWLRNWSGHGVLIEADSRGFLPGFGGAPLRNTANLWRLDELQIDLCDGDGVHVRGYDANAGNATAVSVTQNRGWGINDESALGNTYVGCHARSNGLGPYRFQGGVNASVGVGLYAEADQPPCEFGGLVHVFGGTLGSGHGGGHAVLIAGQSHLLLHSAGGSVAPLEVMGHPNLKAPLVAYTDEHQNFVSGVARQGTVQVGLVPGEHWPMEGRNLDASPAPALRITTYGRQPIAEFGTFQPGYSGGVGTWQAGADGEGWGHGYFEVNTFDEHGRQRPSARFQAGSVILAAPATVRKPAP